MTTATFTASQIDNDLQEVEDYINNSHAYDLQRELHWAGEDFYAPDVNLIFNVICGDYEGAFEDYEEEPTDEQVKRLHAASDLFALKVAPAYLERSLWWVKEMTEGEAKQDCLKQIQDFLTEQTTTTNN